MQEPPKRAKKSSSSSGKRRKTVVETPDSPSPPPARMVPSSPDFPPPAASSTDFSPSSPDFPPPASSTNFSPSSPDFPPPLGMAPPSPDFPPPGMTPPSPDFPPPSSIVDEDADEEAVEQQQQRGVDETVYVRTFDTYTVSVEPLDIRKGRLDKSVVRTIAKEIGGKCGRSGYVRPNSIELKALSAGRCAQNGYIEFEAHVMYDCCRPLLNSVLPAPLCVCTSNNEAAIMGEIKDSHGNVVAMVLLSREGIAAAAGETDVVGHLVASPNEMADVQPGDTFGCIVRTVQFELMDPMVTIMGQLLSARVEQYNEQYENVAAEADDNDVLDADADDTGNIRNLREYLSIMAVNRTDLPDLRRQLVAEKAEHVTDGKAFSSSSSSSSSSACKARTLVEFKLANDHTAYITIALQETPLLATNVTVQKRGTAQQTTRDSFLQAWNKHPALRSTLLNHLRDKERGTAPLLDRNKRPVFDDIVELRYQNQDNFGYKLATTFMPAHAKAVYEFFGAKRILDPCGGWGDRLAGALALREATQGALAQKYVCFDPNRALRRGYRRIAELFDVGEQSAAPAASSADRGSSIRFDNGFEAHSLPFEEGAPDLLEDSSFDLVFTSPPFFNYEVYSASNPDYQSDWLGRFYRPLMLESARCVVPGGRVCIHIDDTSAGQIEPFLCEEVPRTMNLRLEGRIALRGVFSAKPRSVWVFRVTK